MSGNRGQARRAEKLKRKRADVKKKQSAAQAALRPSALLKRATDFPITETWLSTSWRDGDEDLPGVVTALVVRRAPGGLLLSTALLDRTCLGVKEAWATSMTATEYATWLREVREDIELEKVEPELCLSVVHHALDYAKSLGFAPHPDFVPGMFSPRPEPLLDTPLARPAKPLYIAGEHDDVGKVFRKLREAVGHDFRYLIPAADAEDYPVEAHETMARLELMQQVHRCTQLLSDGKLDEADALSEELLVDFPDEPEVAELKAQICEEHGDLKGALVWLRKAFAARAERGEVDEDETDLVREELRRLVREHDAQK